MNGVYCTALHPSTNGALMPSGARAFAYHARRWKRERERICRMISCRRGPPIRGSLLGNAIMSDTLKLTPSLLSMLERIERHSGTLLLLTVTASGGREYTKLNKLRGAGYVVKCDHPSVTVGTWPAEALAITDAGRAALAKHRAGLADTKGRHRRAPA